MVNKCFLQPLKGLHEIRQVEHSLARGYGLPGRPGIEQHLENLASGIATAFLLECPRWHSAM